MAFYKDLEKRKEIVKEYIKNNPTATFREIKEKLFTKINKVYTRGMDEAYEDAGIPKPRTLKLKTKEEKRNIIVDFISKNPIAGGQVIKKETKINFLTIFKNTKEAYLAAGVDYPRESFRRLKGRKKEERREEIIKIIRNNPEIGTIELGKLSKTSIYKEFDNIEEIYREAGVKYLGKGAKKRLKKQKMVIDYIKHNPFATQREINRTCKTHVQLIFEDGIFGAYKKAGITFPFDRLNSHGVLVKEIRERARNFEAEMAIKLSGYGLVNRLVKTKTGYADIILERKGNKAIIEVKDYLSHEISISQVKQLNRYMEDTKSNVGFLICRNKPKKDRFLIGSNEIFIVSESEISKIPEIMDP